QVLASSVTLSPYEADSYESGGRRFEKIVRFATVDCVKAGWLVKDKGIWTITEAGQAAHAELQDPEAFYKRACKLYAEWKAAQPDSEGSAAEVAAAANAVNDVDNNAKAASVTFDEAEEQAWAEVSQYLRAMNPYDFQELVADLLRAPRQLGVAARQGWWRGHPGLARCAGHAPAAHQGSGEATAKHRRRRRPAVFHGRAGR
ncbi:MAG: winged helix-turn-helix domain-containing protein, partial [Gammaproteobacteria bacterium]